LLTMQHFAEEKKNGSFELLMTAPLPLWAIIMGKWLSSISLCLLFLLSSLMFPYLLSQYGEPDMGIVTTSYVGFFLCCSAFVSVGLFASSLSAEPVSCGLIAIFILLGTWLSGKAAIYVETDWLATFLSEISFQNHLKSFYMGVLDSTDVLWFFLFIGGFLFLTWRSIESQRWR